MRPSLVALLVAPVLLLLAGCSGDKDAEKESGQTPIEVLTAAKQALDETSGIEFTLKTPELPKSISGVTSATGVGTHQPAFEGSISLVFSGISADVAVRAVDGKVYAVLPFTKDYAEIDPAEYNAPDPARLLSPDDGISSWLIGATEVTKGDASRDGATVLTTYQGILPGEIVAKTIPSADTSADFEAAFSISDDGKLKLASLTGPFYKGEPDLTYNVSIDKYDVVKTVTAP